MLPTMAATEGATEFGWACETSPPMTWASRCVSK